MKQVLKDLKNTYITHWGVGSDRANGREYLTSTLFSIIVLAFSIEFCLYFALGDLYMSTDTTLTSTAPQAIILFYQTTGGFSGWLIVLLVIQIFLSIPLICLDWRRLHDFGWSGWNILWISLIGSIPYVSWLVILFMFLKKGDPEENKYGLPVNYKVAQNIFEEE